MLRLAMLFLVIALVAAMLGFTTVAGTAFAAARVLFFVFFALLLFALFAAVLITRSGAP